ncbi:hypothetical protein, partial [Vibrio vulnificus]|uniref:hypothetical protein n=1 Tax=Vibrio vulnificus TaxID=672 RepID=UPI0039B6DD32
KKNESELITWEMGERLDEQYASCSRSDLIAFGLVASTEEDDEDEDSELEELGEPGFSEDDPDEDDL